MDNRCQRRWTCLFGPEAISNEEQGEADRREEAAEIEASESAEIAASGHAPQAGPHGERSRRWKGVSVWLGLRSETQGKKGSELLPRFIPPGLTV